MEVLNPDMICYLASFLDASDIVNVSSTCKPLRSLLFENNKLWRFHFMQRFPDMPTNGIREYDLDWRFLATNKSLEAVECRLQGFHLCKRLDASVRSKEYLAFFCKVTTNGGILILKGELVQPDIWKDSVQINFTHSNRASFLYWVGENGVFSTADFYAVDRMSLTNQQALPIRNAVFKKTILSRSQYKQVGQIAYNDANYFDVSNQLDYNFATAHSIMRGTEVKFGSNTKSVVRPEVAVYCLTGVEGRVSLNALFETFCAH